MLLLTYNIIKPNCVSISRSTYHRLFQFNQYFSQSTKIRRFNFNKPKKFKLISGVIVSGITLYSCKSLSSNSSSIAFCEAPNKQSNIIDEISVEKFNKNSLSIWIQLLQILKPDLVWFLISIPSALLSAYFSIQINLALGDLMHVMQQCLKSSFSSSDNFFGDFINLMKEPAKNLLINYFFQSFFTFFYLYSLFVMAEQTANRIRFKLFKKFLSFELKFYDLHDGGQVLSAISNDVLEFKSSFKQVVSLGIRNIAQVLGCVFTLYRISPEMTILINIIVLPTLAVFGREIGVRLRRISNKLHNQLAIITNVAFESINNIRTVKMLCVESILLNKFLDELTKFNHLNHGFSVGFALFQGLTNLSINGIVLSTLLLGGYHLLSGRLSVKNMMAFLATTQTIQRSLFQLSLLYGHHIKVTSSLQKICSYLAIESPDLKGKSLPIINGQIEFRDVIFNYPTRPEYTVLKKLNLIIEAGKITALCGSSGSGKSTIAMLIESLYDLNSGSILLDGIDLKNLDKHWLRKDVIGYISQEPILFCTSIKENIRFGNPKATDQEVMNAAKLANAHDFVANFSHGYDTVVGQQGTALSGGQRQRIAIARAIIKNPKILILDEATSALDTESEALVKEALDKVMKDRTVLVIAHRLSTIINSDSIIVLENGRILEQGTHQELLAKKGKYFQMVNRTKNHDSDLLDE